MTFVKYWCNQIHVSVYGVVWWKRTKRDWCAVRYTEYGIENRDKLYVHCARHMHFVASPKLWQSAWRECAYTVHIKCVQWDGMCACVPSVGIVKWLLDDEWVPAHCSLFSQFSMWWWTSFKSASNVDRMPNRLQWSRFRIRSFIYLYLHFLFFFAFCILLHRCSVPTVAIDFRKWSQMRQTNDFFVEGKRAHLAKKHCAKLHLKSFLLTGGNMCDACTTVRIPSSSNWSAEKTNVFLFLCVKDGHIVNESGMRSNDENVVSCARTLPMKNIRTKVVDWYGWDGLVKVIDHNNIGDIS